MEGETEQPDEKSTRLDESGDEQKDDAQEPSSEGELGKDTGERDISAQDAPPEAVDEVDQAGELTTPEGEQLGQGGPGAEDLSMAGGGMALMEQWLDQVEGDPGQLMEQQIKLEEYQFLRSNPGPPYEPRPW